MQGYHGALLGCNTGWDRYLDDHLGVWCEAPFKLDSAGPKLCEAGVGFHAHSGSGGSRVGSLWTAGAGNVAVELRGEFDYRFFNESALGMLDYCAKDSSGHCEPGRGARARAARVSSGEFVVPVSTTSALYDTPSPTTRARRPRRAARGRASRASRASAPSSEIGSGVRPAPISCSSSPMPTRPPKPRPAPPPPPPPSPSSSSSSSSSSSVFTSR